MDPQATLLHTAPPVLGAPTRRDLRHSQQQQQHPQGAAPSEAHDDATARTLWQGWQEQSSLAAQTPAPAVGTAGPQPNLSSSSAAVVEVELRDTVAPPGLGVGRFVDERAPFVRTRV